MSARLEQLCLLYLDCQRDALQRYREAAIRGAPVRGSEYSIRLLERIRSFDSKAQLDADEHSALSQGLLNLNELRPTQREIRAPAGSHFARSDKLNFLTEPSPARPRQTFSAEHPQEGTITSSRIVPPNFVKVGTERLDKLIELVGEMMVFSTVLVRLCKLYMGNKRDVVDAAHRVERFSRELQDISISLRLNPIRGLFQKMQRLVWDTSRRTGKKVQFEMEGEDTELDRILIDRLADPLMHLVRNSLDHGIEPEDERVANGKAPEGTIKLSAYHSGGNVHIKIQDDGRGLNTEHLIAKSVEKGVLEEGKRLSEEEALQLIFAAGFSTASQVTDISGRGVGMDVVRRSVEELRGRIHIESKVGRGAAFAIELPLTLAIVDGIQIAVGSESFIIPSLSIIEFFRPRADMISRAMNSAETFLFRGKYLPFFRLSEVYHIQGATETAENAMIVVLEDNGEQCGFLVDSIEGQCSTVIKTLGSIFQDLRGISGGAIMPQGNVVLVLDVKFLISFSKESYHQVTRPPLMAGE